MCDCRRDKEHSTIIYEAGESDTALLRLGWNKQDPRYMATLIMDTCKVGCAAFPLAVSMMLFCVMVLGSGQATIWIMVRYRVMVQPRVWPEQCRELHHSAFGACWCARVVHRVVPVPRAFGLRHCNFARCVLGSCPPQT